MNLKRILTQCEGFERLFKNDLENMLLVPKVRKRVIVSVQSVT